MVRDNKDFIREPDERLKQEPSHNDPIKSRDVYIRGQRHRLRSYKPEAMKELCNTCTRVFGLCDHVLQPLPSPDGQRLCIEYSPDPSTRVCQNCKSLNKVRVDNVRCWKCGLLLVVPNPYLRIQKVKIDEEGNIRRILKRNVTK